MRHDSDVVRELADVDALTRVLNRRALSESLQDALGASDEPIALLFLDLDCFKALNDSQGHHAGDCALVAVAAALRHELRPQDLLGRYGGEEFLAVLRGVELPLAIHVATRLCRRVHRLEIPVDERQRLLTVSIGVAMRRSDDTVESLVERADHAMYRAKLEGRNRVRVDEKLLACSSRERAAAVTRGSTASSSTHP
jgi:diguanylate cyclase (GGDEF)-like protein